MHVVDFTGQVLVVGAIATAVLDLWQGLAQRAFDFPRTNWTLVGRWFASIPHGRLVHPAIGKAPPMPAETTIGWMAHYFVGFVYATVYLALINGVPGFGFSFASALGFGLVTVLAPWLILQPGMGLGVFARKAPRPGLARTLSLASHAVFGIGLYLGMLAFGKG